MCTSWMHIIVSQSVQGDLRSVTDARTELEQKYNDLISQRAKETPCRTASEWKQVEEEKKVRVTLSYT